MTMSNTVTEPPRSALGPAHSVADHRPADLRLSRRRVRRRLLGLGPGLPGAVERRLRGVPAARRALRLALARRRDRRHARHPASRRGRLHGAARGDRLDAHRHPVGHDDARLGPRRRAWASSSASRPSAYATFRWAPLLLGGFLGGAFEAVYEWYSYWTDWGMGYKWAYLFLLGGSVAIFGSLLAVAPDPRARGGRRPQRVPAWAGGQGAPRGLTGGCAMPDPNPIEVNAPMEPAAEYLKRGKEQPGRSRSSGLTWRPYGRSRPVLAGLDLTIAPGERVLLAGPSGSGKSTLLRGIAGLLLTADAGDLSGDGDDRWPGPTGPARRGRPRPPGPGSRSGRLDHRA